MSPQPKQCFPAKTHGYGWGLACAWQGWVVLGVYLVLSALTALFLLQSPEENLTAFLVMTFGLSGGLILTCWLKGEVIDGFSLKMCLVWKNNQ